MKQIRQNLNAAILITAIAVAGWHIPIATSHARGSRREGRRPDFEYIFRKSKAGLGPGDRQSEPEKAG
jgi:hypothetical protein